MVGKEKLFWTSGPTEKSNSCRDTKLPEIPYLTVERSSGLQAYFASHTQKYGRCLANPTSYCAFL